MVGLRLSGQSKACIACGESKAFALDTVISYSNCKRTVADF